MKSSKPIKKGQYEDKLLNYREVSNDYTLVFNDDVVNFTVGNFTATLPTAVGIQGKRFTITNTSNEAITLDSLGFVYPEETIDVVSNNINWIII